MVRAAHIRRQVADLQTLLEASEVLAHPCVIRKLALGNLPRRASLLRDLQELPQAVVASDRETLHLIEQFRLFGCGIGYVDAHLLASVLLSVGSLLWTFDKNLNAAAVRLRIAYAPPA